MNLDFILVVDDDRDLLMGLKIRLSKSGFDVVSAPDGITAMSIVARRRPDIILLDLGLPAGDGFHVLKWLKNNSNFSDIPVVVVTAWDVQTHMAPAMVAGAEAYLQKPVDNQRLLMAIRNILARRAEAASLARHVVA